MDAKTNMTDVLITSYKNLNILAARQLECIKQEDYTVLAEIIAQKQLVIDSVDRLLDEVIHVEETSSNQQELARIIRETLLLENSGQELLESKKPEMIRNVLSKNRGKLIDMYFGERKVDPDFLEEKI